jgi:hypothetical protein
MKLEKYSFGMGDRFGKEGAASKTLVFGVKIIYNCSKLNQFTILLFIVSKITLDFFVNSRHSTRK